MAPLKSESRVFGVLVAARREANAFESVECEFLRRLSEHVALAAHQAQLYESLQQAYHDLRQTQQAAMQEERLHALGQMASGIAHDINNTLSPVSLYAESLLETEKNLSERARGYLETIQRAVDDVAETVARMREFYRQREKQLELAPVDVNQLVQQVLDLTRVRWSDMPQQHGISIQAMTELAPDLPRIMGVESEIREALVNLVFNAVDAMTEGGALTLRTRLHGGRQQAAVAIEVADEGVGMDEETRRRCLEPFFTTKGERGTGLGLAMVFGTVQRHSAVLEIESAPGAGTTMRLVFAASTGILAEPAGPAETLRVPSPLRLLLVDDDPVLLKSLRDALETDGHVVVEANGGEAGIAAFRTALDRGETYAAVFTDLGMPYVDGRKVAAAVKQASPATPVILLTGWGRRLMEEGEIPPHVDRVLSKPPKLREVREALAQLCRPTPAGPGA
jgi:signal transduction histidine kinase/ActR/RegA family two-component response regulator